MELPAVVAHALGPPGPLLLFLVCVAVATAAQTLTGFAFGLILVALAASLQLASVSDAANASTLLTLINTGTYFAGHRGELPWKIMRPSLIACLPGVAVGVLLLTWLSGHAVGVLRGLLGVAIIACAALLLIERARATHVGPPVAFATAGAAAGLLGGLFGTSGPPIVFHLYRQPLPPQTIRDALLMLFVVSASTRLVMVLATGGFTTRSVLLALLAFPLVAIVTRLLQRRPPPISAGLLRVVVAVLLAGAGIALLVQGWART